MVPSLAFVFITVLYSAMGDLSFVAIGDWGGEDDEHPTTESQELTAAALRNKARDIGADFALLMGDNIYRHGISCSAESSSRFRETFKDVYADFLPELPFYIMAGNHDYGEGIQANVSAQLAYSQFDSQWRFPALWYKIHREFNAGTHLRSLDVLVIDTVVLCGNGPTNEAFIDHELRSTWSGTAKLSSQKLRQAAAEEQWAWLEQELRNSTADFLWVTGHYPIWSVGSDGSKQCLIDRLRPMLIKYGAHYISGHDHMLEHFHDKGLNTFVAGAGKECCYPAANVKQVPSGSMKYILAGHHGEDMLTDDGNIMAHSAPMPYPVHGGFASLRFDAEHVSVTFHADNGHDLYTAAPIPRRGKASSSMQILPLQPVWFVISATVAVVVSLSWAFKHDVHIVGTKKRMSEPLLVT